MPPAEQFLVAAAGTTTLAVLVHLAPWSYPSPLTTADDEPTSRERELAEVISLFTLVVTGLGYAALVFRGVVSDVELLSVGDWRLDLVLAVSAVVHVLVPLGLELGVRGRSLSALGFRLPTNWFPAAFLVAFGIGVGVSAIGSGRVGPRPPLELVAALWTPVFEEELFYRGVVQSKLERAIGQQWAWVTSGVLFGVAHAPTDFFGQFWITGGGDVAVATARLASQIGFGLLFGVVYAKTRSLLAPVLAHYCGNELGAIVESVDIP